MHFLLLYYVNKMKSFGFIIVNFFYFFTGVRVVGHFLFLPFLPLIFLVLLLSLHIHNK